MSSKRKVDLVEDHSITREGFAQLINYQEDFARLRTGGAVSRPWTESAKPSRTWSLLMSPCLMGRSVPIKISALSFQSYASRLSGGMTNSMPNAPFAGRWGYVTMKQELTHVVLTRPGQVLQDETDYLPNAVRSASLKTAQLLRRRLNEHLPIGCKCSNRWPHKAPVRLPVGCASASAPSNKQPHRPGASQTQTCRFDTPRGDE